MRLTLGVRVRRSTDAEDSSLAQVSGFVGAVVMDTPPSGTLWTGMPEGDGQGDGEEEEGQQESPGGGQGGGGGAQPPQRDGSDDE